jgi:xylulokinase
MGPWFIGVDLGTSGIKAGVVDANGRVVASDYWSADLETTARGGAVQSIDGFYARTLEIIRRVCREAGVAPKEVAALAIDGQMGGVVGVDDAFEPLTGFDMGLDSRAEAINTRFHERHAHTLFSISCGSPRNAPKIAWWKEKHPEVYERVRRFTCLGSYVAGRMCGLRGDEAYIDDTLIAFYGNEDGARRRWSPELTSLWGIDDEKLPVLRTSTDRIGVLTPEAARECGLLAGTPVAAGAGDQPAGFLGAGLTTPGDLVDVAGSTTLLCLSVDEFRPDTRDHSIMYMPGVRAGTYHATWYINGGGLSLPWFCREILGGADMDEVSAAARDVAPGSDGVSFVPYLGGRQCPLNNDLRGAWIGLTLGHRAPHLFRAVVEGIAFAYADGLRRLVELFPEFAPGRAYAAGGGSRSELLMEVKSAVLRLGYLPVPGFDIAVRGSAMIAAESTGAPVDSWTDVRPDTPPRTASGTLRAAYRKVEDHYRNLLDRPLAELMSSEGVVQ